MAQPPNEDRKPDFSSLPRGAIGIKGLPVSRNTRLPSIRSPRDLTLGALPKKTYMPNIPVRREKKPPVRLENASQPKQEIVGKFDMKKNTPQPNDRGRWGRGRGQIVQTQGAIFSEGVAQDPLTRKEKIREAYQRSDSISRGISIKKEKDDDISGVNKKMDGLLRDDFIDDGDDDDDLMLLKPTIFPTTTEVKKEAKSEVIEPAANFDPNIAKEMGFDVNQVAKFIKKERDMEIEEKKNIPLAEKPSDSTKHSIEKAPINDISNIINEDKLVLLQFPELPVVNQKMDDSEPSRKQSANADFKVPDNQNTSCASIKSLPEGYVGKLRVMKSGKAKLVIGSMEFNIGSIDTLISKHELVSIRTDQNVGDLAVLGTLEHKLKFAPNVNSILA